MQDPNPSATLLLCSQMSHIAYVDPLLVNTVYGYVRKGATLSIVAEDCRAPAQTTDDFTRTCLMEVLKQVNRAPIFFDTRTNKAPLRKGCTQAYAFCVGRTAYVAFRGTESAKDVLRDLDVRRHYLPQGVCIHKGFYCEFGSIKPLLTKALADWAGQFDELVLTGHSLGGALASVAAFYYGMHARTTTTEKAADPDAQAPRDGAASASFRVCCYTFGAPRVGNRVFVRRFQSLVDDALRVQQAGDPVPMVPFSWRFRHTHKSMTLLEDGARYVCTDRDTPWYIRLCVSLPKINLETVIREHSMKRYVQCVERLANISKIEGSRV